MMRCLSTFRAATLLALVTTPQLWAQAPRDALGRELEAQTTAMSAAFRRGDMRAVAAFYADDAKIYKPSGHVVSGRRAIDRLWAQFNAGTWTMRTIEFGGSRDEAFQLVESEIVTEENAHRSVARTYCLFLWRRDASGRLRASVDMYTPMRD